MGHIVEMFSLVGELAQITRRGQFDHKNSDNFIVWVLDWFAMEYYFNLTILVDPMSI